MTADVLALKATGLDFSYQDDSTPPLFSGFSIEIQHNSHVVVLGASGCGKSTLGKLLAGVVDADSGSVTRSERLSEQADVVYLDQSPMNAVFPWQLVLENIEYPLRKLGWARDQIHERGRGMLSRFGLTALSNKYPAALSGGELQRLALARILAWRPRLAILDESLSALDPATKDEAIATIQELSQEGDMTLVTITHSLTDALELGDRFVVLAGSPVRVIHDFSADQGSQVLRQRLVKAFYDARV